MQVNDKAPLDGKDDQKTDAAQHANPDLSDALEQTVDGAKAGESEHSTGKQAECDCAHYKQIAQRAQADLVNYKRRIEKERDGDRSRERRRTLLKVVEVLDQMEAALSSMPKEIESDWTAGISAIYKNFVTLLENGGFERFEALSGVNFDPVEHEALSSVQSDEYPEGAVVSQVRAGYRHDGVVLRPALVQISNGQ